MLAKCDDSGELRAEGGRVEIRYNPKSDKAYQASVRNLSVVSSGALIADADVAEASAAPAKKSGGGKRGSGAKAGTPATPPEGSVVAYTDGACSGNPGPAGLGVVLIDGDHVRELSLYLGHGTNNVGELAAIGEAADAVQDTSRAVYIHTDSQYSIGVLTKGWKAKKNVELIGKVKVSLARLQDVTLIYVKGHAGIELNERADGLAVRAVQERASSGWTDA